MKAVLLGALASTAAKKWLRLVAFKEWVSIFQCTWLEVGRLKTVRGGLGLSFSCWPTGPLFGLGRLSNLDDLVLFLLRLVRLIGSHLCP